MNIKQMTAQWLERVTSQLSQRRLILRGTGWVPQDGAQLVWVAMFYKAETFQDEKKDILVVADARGTGAQVRIFAKSYALHANQDVAIKKGKVGAARFRRGEGRK